MRRRHRLMLLRLHCFRRVLLQRDRSAARPRETLADSGGGPGGGGSIVLGPILGTAPAFAGSGGALPCVSAAGPETPVMSVPRSSSSLSCLRNRSACCLSLRSPRRLYHSRNPAIAPSVATLLRRVLGSPHHRNSCYPSWTYPLVGVGGVRASERVYWVLHPLCEHSAATLAHLPLPRATRGRYRFSRWLGADFRCRRACRDRGRCGGARLSTPVGTLPAPYITPGGGRVEG
ncbi:hypothetical protein KC350_g26 [Hortaea werneckii]|nr:hypothetical protein KC350_g26 [Hortaea werneckii]